MAAPSSIVLSHHVGANRQASVPARAFQLLARSRYTKTSKKSNLSFRQYSSYPQQQQPEAGFNHKSTQAQQSHGDQPSLAEAIKLNMRAVKTPVSIITSSDPRFHIEGGNQGWKGATVASFNTVSMTPVPLVSFNIHQHSSTLDAIRHSEYFAVNILAHTSSAAILADTFAKPNTQSPFTRATDLLGKDFHAGTRWFMPERNMRALKSNQTLPPRLQVMHGENYDPQPMTFYNNKAVLFALLCHTHEQGFMRAGDHVVVLGRVVHLLSRRGTKTFLGANSPSRNKPLDHDGANNLTYQYGRYSATFDESMSRRRPDSPFNRRSPTLQNYVFRPSNLATGESDERRDRDGHGDGVGDAKGNQIDTLVRLGKKL